MKKRKTTEDYLKTIYSLSGKGTVHGYQIAEQLRVSRPTVSNSLKSLALAGYLYVDELKNIHLTDMGLALAQRTQDRYRIIKELLMDLGVDPKTAVMDACEMEHAMGQDSFDALKALVQKRRKIRTEG